MGCKVQHGVEVWVGCKVEVGLEVGAEVWVGVWVGSQGHDGVEVWVATNGKFDLIILDRLFTHPFWPAIRQIQSGHPRKQCQTWRK